MAEQPWTRARRPWTLVRFTEYGYEYCPIVGLCAWYDWRELQYCWAMQEVKREKRRPRRLPEEG